MIFSVYEISNTVNNKLYIGYTSKSISYRFAIHRNKAKNGSNYIIHNAINKYGATNFKIKKLSVHNTLEEALMTEYFYILVFQTKSPYGYNMTDGGEGTTGYKKSKKQINAHKKVMLGKPAKNKIAVVREDGKKYDSMQSAAIDNNCNVSQISNVIKGYTETVQNYRFFPILKELKIKQQKLRKSRKLIKNLQKKKIIDNYGNLYNSISDAAKKLNLQISNISKVLNKHRNHTGGYYFEYCK